MQSHICAQVIAVEPAAAAAAPAPPKTAAPAPASNATVSTISPPKTIASALKASGFTDCLKLIEAASGAARAANPNTTATVLCPTNAGVESFLGEMGLSLAELTNRTDLLDKLVAYHIVPRARASAARLAGKSKEGSYAVSGDPHYLLRFSADPKSGAVSVRDSQGNAARVLAADVDAGRSVVHGVDRVLMSGA